MRSLARDPRYRFPTVQMFATALEQVCQPQQSQVQRSLFSSFTFLNQIQQKLPLRINQLQLQNQLPLRNFLLLLVAILFVITGTVATVGAAIHTNQMNSLATATAQTQATTTAQTNATATAQAQTDATATAQAQAQADATSTAQALTDATATAQANTNPYVSGGTLAFSDPLSDNTQGNGWGEGTSATGGCASTAGAHHVSNTSTSNSSQGCEASGDFSNFVIEVQMSIVKGDSGGILFRANNQQKTYYIFYIDQNGEYDLLRGDPGSTTPNFLVQPTPSSAINSGTGQTNTIAVVAQGSTITLYANHQQLTSINDSSYSHGQIGVMASTLSTGGQSTEVAYSNAKVWTL